MRLFPDERLLKNLQQKIPHGRRGYIPHEEAYELLKAATGQDFGYDADAWKTWFKQNPLDPSKFAKAVVMLDLEKRPGKEKL